MAGSAGGNEPDADIYRNAILTIPKTPPGWKRQNIVITVQSDGLRLNYTIVDIDQEYLVENHCIMIKSPNGYDHIVKSFEDSRTKQFIEYVFCNNAMNIQEFLYVLPIYS